MLAPFEGLVLALFEIFLWAPFDSFVLAPDSSMTKGCPHGKIYYISCRDWGQLGDQGLSPVTSSLAILRDQMRPPRGSKATKRAPKVDKIVTKSAWHLILGNGRFRGIKCQALLVTISFTFPALWLALEPLWVPFGLPIWSNMDQRGPKGVPRRPKGHQK